MNTNNTFIWIDVSKKSLHIYDQKIKQYFKINNTEKNISDFFANYSTDYYIIYEPTGTYSKTLEKVLNNLNLKHLLVHPNDMHHLINSLGLNNKNDELDARWIAQVWQTLFNQIQNLDGKNKFIQPNSNKVNQLHHYMSQIRSMKDQIVKLKQSLEILDNNPYDSKKAREIYKDTIKGLEDGIKTIEDEIIQLLTDMNMYSKFEDLQTIPWVWRSVALEMMVFFMTMQDKWFTKDNNKQVIAYTWLNPIENQSGSSKDWSYLSRQGDPNIRTSIYMTGIQWCKWCNDPRYKDTTLGKFVLRMKEKFSSSKNKRWKSVGCAVWKKVIEIGRAMFCDGTEYNFS